MTHVALIAAAVWATSAPRFADGRVREKVVAVALASPQAPPPVREKAEPVVHTEKPKGFQVLAIPATIPDHIPPVDRARAVTLEADFSGHGVMGGIAAGIPLPALTKGDPIDASLADQSPYLLPDQLGPAYPEALRADRPDGLVVVRFVIDTLGRVEAPSLRVLEATNSQFASSVRDALEHLRYVPAIVAGRRIRVSVEQKFEFHLAAP